MIKKILFFLVLSLWSFLASTGVVAHTTSDGFIALDIEGQALSGQYDVALQDLEVIIGLDQNQDGKITWGELKVRESEIFSYLVGHLELRNGDDACAIVPIDLQVSELSGGAFASVIFETSCDARPISKLLVRYSGMFDEDAQHRGLLSIFFRDKTESAVFSKSSQTFEYDLASRNASTKITQFITEGINHIFHGIDHMLFLVALVLPAVYVSRGKRYQPQEKLTDVVLSALKVVTAFTAAHTITLCLTSFSVISPPPLRVVEVLVALTILLTAINNLRPVVSHNFWLVGFCFGLIHGVGYASVLNDLGLSGWSLAKPLIGFNLGVELAQIMIIGLFLPLAFALRRTNFYYFVFLMGGSTITAGLAGLWMYEQISGHFVLFF